MGTVEIKLCAKVPKVVTDVRARDGTLVEGLSTSLTCSPAGVTGVYTITLRISYFCLSASFLPLSAGGALFPILRALLVFRRRTLNPKP